MTNVVKACLQGKFTEATQHIDIVFNEGYNLIDIINTLTKVIQNMTDFKSEELRLNYLKEASMIKMKTLEGNNS
jgi:DNA polymerase III delta subunit